MYLSLEFPSRIPFHQSTNASERNVVFEDSPKRCSHDNGTGFEPALAGQMFIIFQRLNEKKKYPGTGFGLALCKKIVNNHRGHIFARPAKDGAEFYVVLPVRQEKLVRTLDDDQA